MWFGLGGFLLVVGATLAWLVNVPVVGIGHLGLGVVLMVGGAASLVYGVVSRRRYHDGTGTDGAPGADVVSHS